MNRHIFKSDYYLWVVLVKSEGDVSAHLQVERNLTGKRKGPRLACVMDIYGIDRESPHGQWIQALMTSGDDGFPKWVQSFHNSRPTKTVIVDFANHRLICKPGLWIGCVGLNPQKNNETEVTSYPP